MTDQQSTTCGNFPAENNAGTEHWLKQKEIPRREIVGPSSSVANEFRPLDKQQPLELIPDFPYESRHEFVEKLAYKLWEQRGLPFDSPDVDWFAAEQAVYASLVESGMITPSPNAPQNIGEVIYR